MNKINKFNKIVLAVLFVIIVGGFIFAPKSQAAYLNITGFETGDLNEMQSNNIAASGLGGVQGTIKRTGSYSLRSNPINGASWARIGKLDTSGQHVSLGGSTPLYITLYFYVAAMPSSNQQATQSIFRISDTSGGEKLSVRLNSSGSVRLYNGTSESSSLGTISTGTWYRFDLKWVQNGTSEGILSGGGSAQMTGTPNVASDYLYLGEPSVGASFDIYYDDITISDSAYPGAGQVNILKPNAAGATNSWTSAAYTDVNEVPPNGTTTQSFHNSDGSATYFYVNLDSSATAGVGGTIGTAKAVAIIKGGGAGSEWMHLGIYTPTSSVQASNFVLSGTYAAAAKLSDTDPSTGAAWTTTGLDGAQVYVGNGAAAGRTVYATAMYLMVWNTGVSAPTITSPTQTSITASGATLGGNVTSDGGSAVTGRGVCVGTSANPTTGCTSTTGTTGIFTVGVTGLAQGTLYHYRAYATNAIGTSYTTDDSFTTLGPPSTTTSAASGLATNSAILNSTINPNGVSTNVSYLWGTTAGVSCALQPNTLAGPTALTGTANLSGATTQATLGSLSGNATYYFCVMATNTYGTTYGSVISFTTNANPGAYTLMDAGSALGGGATDCNDASAAPCAPTGGSAAAASQTQMNVSWTAGVGPVATSYNLAWCSGVSCTPGTTITGVTSIYAHTGLTCGTTYGYNVIPVNASGSGPASATFYGSTSSCATPPSIPGSFTATANADGSMGLSWAASTGTPTITYHVQRCAGTCTPSADLTTTTGTSFSDTTGTSLACGSTYSYSIFASNAGGNSGSTAVLTRTATACPGIPTGLTATAQGNKQQINLSWANGGGGVSSYTIYWCSGSACTPSTQITGISSASYQHTGLTCGTIYRYTVQQVSQGGSSAQSTAVQASTTAGSVVTCYQDNDNDTYAPSGAATSIMCGSCGSGYTATQPTTTGSSGNTDCYDGSANAYPGSTNGGVGFGSSRGDGSFDFNCDNATSYGSGGSGGNYCGFYESRYYNPGNGCQNNFLCTSGPFFGGTLSCGTQTVTTNATYTTYSDSFCSVPFGSGSSVSVVGTISCY